jgi:NitT/TauT family transport system ATP-binding protein
MDSAALQPRVAPAAPAVSFHDVAVRFDTPSREAYVAVTDITIDIPEGRFVAIVGPSGCGKSTLLNAAAGLLRPSRGHVEILGARLAGINTHATYLFQQDALLPWRTVLDNVMLGPLFQGAPRAEAERLARDWLQRVGLASFADRFPHQLSGGMRKRVAIAQTWIIDPRILLMDEPFSSLDVQVRQMMETELLNLWQGSDKTVLFVTHDLEEAIALSDEVIVLSAGPARIKGVYPVPLARPRDVAEIRLDPCFDDLYRRIWGDLRDEVRRQYERQEHNV